MPAVLTLAGRRVVLTALVDTGNTLTDPATGRPVLVAEADSLEELLPPGLRPGPAELDVSQCPDLVPPLAAMAALRAGETTAIVNAARLRIKESDRLASTAALLRALGGSAEEYPDRLVVHGGGLRGGDAQGANDHRIVMAAAVAALGCGEKVCVTDAHAINKSYPDFFDELNKLGGRCNVDMG